MLIGTRRNPGWPRWPYAVDYTSDLARGLEVAVGIVPGNAGAYGVGVDLHGRHAVAGYSTAAPWVPKAGPNGGIECADSAGGFQWPLTSVVNYDDGVTTTVVVQASGAKDGSGRIFNSQNFQHYAYRLSSDTILRFSIRASGTRTVDFTPTTNIWDGDIHVVTFSVNEPLSAANHLYELWIDGQLEGSGTPGNWSHGNVTRGTHMRVGNRQDGGNSSGGGLAFSAFVTHGRGLSRTERAEVSSLEGLASMFRPLAQQVWMLPAGAPPAGDVRPGFFHHRHHNRAA